MNRDRYDLVAFIFVPVVFSLWFVVFGPGAAMPGRNRIMSLLIVLFVFPPIMYIRIKTPDSRRRRKRNSRR